MGSHFVKTGLGNDVASAQYFDTPQQAFSQANQNLQAAGGGRPNFLAQESQATVTPGDPANPEVAPDIQGGTLAPNFLSQPTNLPKIQTPSFLQAQNNPQLANKVETKMGKLFQILGGAASGAGAGAGSRTFGEGFARAQNSDLQRKEVYNQQQQQLIQNQRQAQADKNSQAEADRKAAEAPLDTKLKQQTIQANDAALQVKNQTPAEIQASRTATADGLKLQGDARTKFLADGKLPEDFGKKEKPENIDQQLVDELVKNGMTPLAALEKVNKDKRTHITVNNGAAGSFGSLTNNGATGEDALKGAKPEVATLVRGIAKYEIDPATLSNRNNQRANVIALAKQFDPTYDQRNFGTSKNVMKEFTTGQAAKNLNAFNTATEHLKLLTSLADHLDNGDIQGFNSIANKYKESTGNPAPSNFETAKNAVVGEVAKTFAGQATVSEIHDINETINKAQSPAQLRGAIQTMTDLMGSKKKALQEQYEQGLKNKPAFEGPQPDNTPPPGAKVRDYSHVGAR